MLDTSRASVYITLIKRYLREMGHKRDSTLVHFYVLERTFWLDCAEETFRFHSDIQREQLTVQWGTNCEQCLKNVSLIIRYTLNEYSSKEGTVLYKSYTGEKNTTQIFNTAQINLCPLPLFHQNKFLDYRLLC